MSKGKLSGSPFHIEYTNNHYAPCVFRADDKTCGNATCPNFLNICYNSWKCTYKDGSGRKIPNPTNIKKTTQKNCDNKYQNQAPKKALKAPLPIYVERELHLIDNKTKRRGICPHCGENMTKSLFSFIVYSDSTKSKVSGLSETDTLFCTKCNIYYAPYGIRSYIK